MASTENLKSFDVPSCKQIILAQIDAHTLDNMSEHMIRALAQIVISAGRQKKPETSMMVRLLCMAALCLMPWLLGAQCAAYPAFPGCSVSGSSALAAGASINAAQTYTFSGTATYSSLTLNGGTLVVCGNLTLNAITVNSGTIFIGPGSTLTLYNGGSALALGANTFIYNFGKLDCKMSLVTGSGNILVNCLSTSVFSVTFDQFVIQGPNTFFINNGSFNSSYFIVQSNNSPAPICLGSGSILKTATMINQYSNSFYVQTGSAACVNVTNNVINSNVLTASTGVNVCIPSTISIISGPNWGAANILNNCPACMVILPVQLTDFYGSIEDGMAVLRWNTAHEHNSCLFITESSPDAINFTPVHALAGAGDSEAPRHYISRDTIRPGEIRYYRLKQVDCNGTATYSPIIDLLRQDDADVLVLPNPNSGFINIYAPRHHFSAIQIYDQMGSCILQQTFIEALDLSSIAQGLYYIFLTDASGRSMVKKMQKL